MPAVNLRFMKKRTAYKFYLLSVLMTLTFSSCEKEKEIAIGTRQENQRLYDVQYGTGLRREMDVFLHEDRSSDKPFIIFLHGGSWEYGNKLLLSGMQENVLKKGYSSASINYSFVNLTTDYKKLMDDVHASINQIQKNASNWSIRPNQYILVGHSAGAHLSLLYAYNYQRKGEVKGVVSLAGPTDFSDEKLVLEMVKKNHPLIKQIELMAGIGISRLFPLPVPEQFINASPLHNIENPIPTLLIHGTEDKTVDISQSVALSKVLTEKKVANEFIKLESASHMLGLFETEDKYNLTNLLINWVEKNN